MNKAIEKLNEAAAVRAWELRFEAPGEDAIYYAVAELFAASDDTDHCIVWIDIGWPTTPSHPYHELTNMMVINGGNLWEFPDIGLEIYPHEPDLSDTTIYDAWRKFAAEHNYTRAKAKAAAFNSGLLSPTAEKLLRKAR